MYCLRSLKIFVLSAAAICGGFVVSAAAQASNSADAVRGLAATPNTNDPMREITFSLPGTGEDAAAFVDRMVAQNKLSSNDAASTGVLLNNLGVLLTQRSLLPQAAVALKRAIQNNPQSEFYVNLSIVYERMNQLDDAFATAEKAVNLTPQNARAQGQLCWAIFAARKFQDSIDCYHKLEQIAPFDNESATAYGIALTRTGDLQQAISVLQKLTAASPSNYQAVNALGMAFYKEKDYARAAAAFKSAIEIAPEKGELRYNLAIAQLALRNRAGALGQYKLLQESSPSMADRLSRILFRDKLIFVGNH